MSAFPELDALVRECDDTEAAGITRRDGANPEARNWRAKSRKKAMDELAAAMLRENTTKGSGCVARRRGIERRKREGT